MERKFSSNKIESDDLPSNFEESDYSILVNRLREISETIISLEKKYLDKF